MDPVIITPQMARKACAANPVVDAALAQCAAALQSAGHVLVATHRNPDGDALGSAIAVLLALQEMGKDAYGYCPGPLLTHFLDMPHIDLLHQQPPENLKEFDLTLVLDCAELERVTEDFKPHGRVLNIDHHPTNPLFGEVNCVVPQASATGELVFALLDELHVQITSGMAQALYLAIVSDTGSFRYTNTSPQSFALASCLVQAGADPAAAARLYWESYSPESTRLRGEALARMELIAEGRVAWSQITAAQLAAHGGAVNEPEGLSGQLRGMRGVEAGVLFTEVEGQGVRVSFRSHGNLDVAAVARQFGGGGHRAAAGAFIKDDLEKARARVLEAIVAALHLQATSKTNAG